MKIILRIFKYLYPYRLRVAGQIALSFLLGVLTFATMASVLPLLKVLLSSNESLAEALQFKAERLQFLNEWIKNFVETRLPADRYQVLVIVCIAFFILGFIRNILLFAHCYLAGYVQQNATRDLRNDLHTNTMKYSLAFFQVEGVGAVMSRFTIDLNFMSAGLKSLLEKIIREPFMLIACLIGCYLLNPMLTLIFILFMPLLGVTTLYFGSVIRRYAKKSLFVRASLLRMLEEVFRGIRIVKAMRMEKAEAERFGEENDRLVRRQMRMVIADSASAPVMEIILSLGACIAILIGGYFVVKKGSMDGEELLTFYAMMFGCLDPIRKLAKAFKRMQPMIAAGERVFEIMDRKVEIQEAPDAIDIPPIREKLEFRNVHFGYLENEDVLKGVSLEVKSGQTIALIGPSGSGKSSLINMIPRFYDPGTGGVFIDGVDIRQATLESLRSQISLVSQESILFSDTVANNISYSCPDASQDDIIEAAKKARAHDFIQNLTDGYDTRIGASGVEVSGGERQRIALARAILRDPALLLLDEPTSSLDSHNESLIQEALDEFCIGRTTFVVAHRLSTVRNSDVIIVIADGKIEAIGRHAELMEISPTYKRLHTIQFQSMDRGE